MRRESDGEGGDDFGSDAAEELGGADEIEDGDDSDLELLEEAPPPKRKRAQQGTLQARALAPCACACCCSFVDTPGRLPCGVPCP